MPARRFNDQQEQEICRLYEAGKSTVELGEAFGVYSGTIGRILKRNGVKTRNNSAAHGGLKPEQEAEVCRRYEAGESTCELGKGFGVAKYTIICILKRNGIERRTLKEAQGGLNPEQEAEVCRRYAAGENTCVLEKAFEVARSTINAILKRNGVETRSNIEAQGGLNPEQEAEVCRRYESGGSTNELGKAFGVGKTTICQILKRNGVERRIPDGHGDSVQHVLDCTGLHTHPRDCDFYLYELARYNRTHCKPGISFDHEDRADDEYSKEEEPTLITYPTRAEAYFLEQAVLDATRGSAQCPEDLLGWDGATEVRAMPACDMEPIVLRLADELEELGVWDFAARYVPMTAAQRAICQQRAMAGAPACAA